jgi:hypothetical protein
MWQAGTRIDRQMQYIIIQLLVSKNANSHWLGGATSLAFLKALFSRIFANALFAVADI